MKDKMRLVLIPVGAVIAVVIWWTHPFVDEQFEAQGLAVRQWMLLGKPFAYGPNTFTELEEELFEAVAFGDTKGVTELVGDGGNISVVNEQGQDLHELAIHQGDKVMSAHLLRYGRPRFSGDALTLAVEEEEYELVVLMLEKGVNPDLINRDGSTPLIRAVQWGEPEYVEALLTHGADPGLTDLEGVAPAQHAERAVNRGAFPDKKYFYKQIRLLLTGARP